MRKGTKDQIQVKQISKEVFTKFKKVRELHSELYQTYLLFCKNGFKYAGKRLNNRFQLQTTRSAMHPIFKYTASEDCTYLFPLHGLPLTSLFGNQGRQQDGEIKRWIQKCGSFESCLFEVLKKMIHLVQVEAQEEILLECLRVYNGELQYCYDNWMKSSFFIVLNNPNELENFYFSQEDLDQIRQMAESKDRPMNINFTSSKMSIIYRVFLMILHVGTHNLRERNYEFSGFKLHQEHLKMRLDYFCSRYNQKGLGDLLKKVISGQAFQMQEIWKIGIPEISQVRTRKALALSNANIKQRKRVHTQLSDGSQTPIKNSHINRLNSSIYSHSSNKSYKEQDYNLETSKLSMYKSKLVNDQNRSRPKSRLSKDNLEANKSKINIKLCRKSLSKDSKDFKQYQLFNSTSKEQFNLKTLLLEVADLPKTNVKILKYLGLQEYLPQSLYEENVIEVLSNIHIKNNWTREVYENGSIYLGEMVQSKKQGKGLYLFNSNDFYLGEWSHNFMDGYGTYIFTSGEIYQGELRKGFKEGHGRCVYPDGKSYEGFWNKNNKIGLGKVKFPNEVIFLGLFKPQSAETEGLFLGPMGQNGKPIWQNKGFLEHYHWQKNTLLESKDKKQELIDRRSKLKHCIAEYYSQYQDESGNLYEGEMVDGKKQGFGIYQTPKQIYEGQWCDDKKYGPGTLFIKNLFSISGEWKNNFLVKYNYHQTEQSL